MQKNPARLVFKSKASLGKKKKKKKRKKFLEIRKCHCNATVMAKQRKIEKPNEF